MVAVPKVVEDEREARAREPVARPRWAWLIVGMVIGAGVSVLALGVENPTPSTVPIPPGSTPIVGGVADVVEGFPDSLVAVTRSDGQSLELLIWPLRGEPYERAIPVGASRPPGPVTFDHSGRRIATVLPVPDQGLGVLYAGIPENAAIVATDVTGYAWHDDEPFQLAYTSFVDGEMLLWEARPDLSDPELVARAVGIEGHVAAWGEWGYAIQDVARDSVVLFTDGGEIKDMHRGGALASYRTGWLAIAADDGAHLLSAGGGVRGLDLEGLEAPVMAGGFSPNGERLALLTRDQVAVVSLENEAVPLLAEGRHGVSELTWSSDGRFVLYPGSRGIWVVDTVEGDAEAVLGDSIFTGIGIAPIGGS